MDIDLAHTVSFPTGTVDKLFFNQNTTSNLIYNCSLEVFTQASPFRNTSIVSTIGPACKEVDQIRLLIRNGMDIARFNFSHGDYAYHGQLMKNVREAAEAEGKPIAIALDTKGPEIRTGLNKDDQKITLSKGDVLSLTTDPSFNTSSTSSKVYIDYQSLCSSVGPGQIILIADGSVVLETKEVKDNEVVCHVISGDSFGNRKNVSLPGVSIDLPALSEKDISDINFGMDEKVDIIFASFIRSGDNVKEIRKLLNTKEEGKNIKIISKIENNQGVNDIDNIIQESDGIMVARGDLGMDLPIEKVIIAQKMIVARCNKAGKPSICATQMLDSMINSFRPTRAEVADVTNAILDGSDCVMLSGETANGKYPDESVLTMNKICREAESMIPSRRVYEDVKNSYVYMPDDVATAMASVSMSFKVKACAIVVLSTTGTTASRISQFRPACPIILVTRFEQTARQSLLLRGVIPLIYQNKRHDGLWSEDVDKRLCHAINYARKIGLCENGSKIVFVSGWKSGPGCSNSVRLLTVAEGDCVTGN